MSLVLSPLQLTSQDHTPQVIQRALEKHHMEAVSCQDFSLCQMLNNGKGICFPLRPVLQQYTVGAGVTCSAQGKYSTPHDKWYLNDDALNNKSARRAGALKV